MIYITDNLRISKVDERCIQIEVRNPTKSRKTGEITDQWKWYGYYGDLKSALYGTFKKQLLDTVDEEASLQEVIKRIELAEQNVINAVKTIPTTE